MRVVNKRSIAKSLIDRVLGADDALTGSWQARYRLLVPDPATSSASKQRYEWVTWNTPLGSESRLARWSPFKEWDDEVEDSYLKGRC
jgi:hypothetical protein